MKKRIVSALLAGFLLVSATACGKQPAADAAQPVADPTQAYLDTVDVDYAYELALKLEDIRSNETLGYRTAGSDAELATGDMLKAEMERIGLQNVTKDAFTLDTQDSLFGLSRRCIPSWVSRAHPSLPSRRIYHFIDSHASPEYHVFRGWFRSMLHQFTGVGFFRRIGGAGSESTGGSRPKSAVRSPTPPT